jgi:Acetylornithine deacetylase/Succinyl-diaminopimelate desuccinylase and related deacylases
MALEPARTVADLEELRALTGDENGAQRVAWTDTWERARDFLRSKMAETGAVEEIDQAGNQWFTLRGASDRELLIGGHMDSVPNGGWLDGCLNVMAGVEVLRRIASEGKPPVTVRLVSWADEEGARFGRSLFGSSAAAGSMRDQDELRKLVDREGVPLPDALAEHGVALDDALSARSQLAMQRRTSSCTSSRGRCWSRSTSARCRARHVRRRALALSRGAARRRTPARRR